MILVRRTQSSPISMLRWCHNRATCSRSPDSAETCLCQKSCPRKTYGPEYNVSWLKTSKRVRMAHDCFGGEGRPVWGTVRSNAHFNAAFNFDHDHDVVCVGRWPERSR